MDVSYMLMRLVCVLPKCCTSDCSSHHDICPCCPGVCFRIVVALVHVLVFDRMAVIVLNQPLTLPWILFGVVAAGNAVVSIQLSLPWLSLS